VVGRFGFRLGGTSLEYPLAFHRNFMISQLLLILFSESLLAVTTVLVQPQIQQDVAPLQLRRLPSPQLLIPKDYSALLISWHLSQEHLARQASPFSPC